MAYLYCSDKIAFEKLINSSKNLIDWFPELFTTGLLVYTGNGRMTGLPCTFSRENSELILSNPEQQKYLGKFLHMLRKPMEVSNEN